MYSSLILFLFVFTLVSVVSAIPYKSPDEKKGVLLLDSITFPKIVPSNQYDVVVLIANKGEIGDYGTDSMRTDYFNFAYKVTTQGEADHVLFCQILVNGAENAKLAQSIGMEPGFKFPKMFVFPAGYSTPIEFPDNEPFEMNSLTRFVSKHSSLYFQVPGTLKVFDKLATQFMETGQERLRRNAYMKALKEVESITEDAEEESARYYLHVMQRILEKGEEFLDHEIERIERIISDSSTKISLGKKRNLGNRMNVLQHFKAFQRTPEQIREQGEVSDARETPDDITASMLASGKNGDKNGDEL